MLPQPYGGPDMPTTATRGGDARSEHARRVVGALTAGLALLGMTLPAGGAGKPRPQPCQPGEFRIDGAPVLTAPAAVGASSITIAPGPVVSLGGACAARTARLRATRRATTIKVRWPSCIGARGAVRLSGTITEGCAVLRARVRGKGLRRRIRAQRVVPVGPTSTTLAVPLDLTALAAAWTDTLHAVLATRTRALAAAALRRPRAEEASLAEEIAGVTVDGPAGRLGLRGLRFTRPRAPRYEVTLDLQAFSTDGRLVVTGPLEYNYVIDDSVDPPVEHGLYRGAFQLGGRFAGAVEVRGAVRGGDPTVVELASGAAALRVGGDAVPGFITVVATVAGTGTAGAGDGPVGQAEFDAPAGITVDRDGVVYVADAGNGAVREIAGGTVATLARGFSRPFDLGVADDTTLVVTDRVSLHNDERPLVRVTRRGPGKGAIDPIVGPYPFAGGLPTYPCGSLFTCDGRSPMARMPFAGGLDVQTGGLVLIAQWALPHALRAVTPDGYLMTLRSSVTTCDPSGVVDPGDVAQGPRGEIYFTSRNSVRVLEPDGEVRTVAGRLCERGYVEGAGDAARFRDPSGVVFDGERYLYVTDGSLVRRVDVETGATVRVAGCLAHQPGFACNDDTGFRDGPGDYAQFDATANLALDRYGDLYVADGDNHAVRLIRIVADPERVPVIQSVDPLALGGGASTTVTIRGRNLAQARAVDLGAGITGTIVETGYRYVRVATEVADDAAPGARQVALTTPYGTVRTPSDLSLTVLDDAQSGPTVETIAGTGEAIPSRINVGPARDTTFVFAAGMHALDADRLLVADPFEQRIRLISSKVGTVEELSDLLVSTAGGKADILGTILGALDTIGSTLELFGIGQAWLEKDEAKIRRFIEQAVDQLCEPSVDCTWLSLPWAGIPLVPGQHDDLRLTATFLLPTDVWHADGHLYYVADTGNRRVRVIGREPGLTGKDVPAVVFSSTESPDYPLSVAAINKSLPGVPSDAAKTAYHTLPSRAVVDQLKIVPETLTDQWAGIADTFRCARGTLDPKQPLGVPLGIAVKDATIGGSIFGVDDHGLFVADPLCRTVWRIVERVGTAEVHDLHINGVTAFLGPCVDGPAGLATFGAPMDVAVDSTGNVYVADAACHSIRRIKDLGFGQDFDGLIGKYTTFLQTHGRRLPPGVRASITQKLAGADTEFLNANRYWVTTVAGSPAAEPGFADGPAARARFSFPTGVAVASQNGATIVFVADTGNRRIRRIVIP